MKPSLRMYLSATSLPFFVLIIIPALTLYFSNDWVIGWNISPIIDAFLLILGLALMFSGLALLIFTARMFSKIGEGTLAPWAPTSKLVVEGIYSYVRNPMITGVLFVVLGESLFFSSLWIFLWFVIFSVGNDIYFKKSEEPGLVARFGEQYNQYMLNVPRWIPRRNPWIPDQSTESS